MFMFAKWKNKKSTLQNKAKEMPAIQNTPEEVENAALFLRPDLPSTLIRHKNAAFRN